MYIIRIILLNLQLETKRISCMKNFKHLIIAAIVAVFAVGQANAEFRFGIKAGLNVNKLHLTNLPNNISSDNQCGVTAGVMTEFTVPIVGIGFDLSLMYTHMNNEIQEGAAEGAVGKDFLEIPLNLKYKFKLPVVSSFLSPMVYTGPTMAVKLDKSTFKELSTKTVQMGWNVGVGLELLKHLQVSGGYTFGINNVAKNIPVLGDNIGKIKVKNNYWTITAAYLF